MRHISRFKSQTCGKNSETKERLNANEVTDTNANRLEYAVAMKLITEE